MATEIHRGEMRVKGKGPLARMTLLQQWTGATVLAILPLLLAVSYAGIALREQTSAQRDRVQRMDELAGHTSTLNESVKELARSARQYALLGDESFLQLYRQKANALSRPLNHLRNTLPGEENRRLLRGFEDAVVALDMRMADPGNLTADTIGEYVSELVEVTEALAAASTSYRREAVRRGERDFNRIVDQLAMLTMLALPGTFLLMVIGTYRVSRPIWRLSQSIRRLGEQDWEVPIHIRGPADLAALGDNLDWMRRQVIASDRQKTAFIQHVTHELKTPLAAIIEGGELLADEVPGRLQPSQKSVLDILQRNARHLQDLIQQLLNYNAVSHGIMAQRQDVDPGALSRSIRASLESSRPDKRLHWVIEGGVEVVPADVQLLQMILTNLLGNAFQFVETGGCVSVRWGLDREARRWWLHVSDTGPGIEPDEIEHIFTPFYKGRTGRRESVPKNGIGLAIVKECVKLLRGNIEVDSTPGEGTTFRMSFPLDGERR